MLWAGCALLLVAAVPAVGLIRSGGGYPTVFAGVLLIGAMLLCFDATLPAPGEDTNSAAFKVGISQLHRCNP